MQSPMSMMNNMIPPNSVRNSTNGLPDYSKAMKNYKPNELFVGNLSYFCEEKDLYELFDQYGNVEDVRIIKNDSGSRSLMFGFVTMASVHEAREMEKLLNNHLFLGRKIRVAISERRYDFKPPGNDGIQMHVSFCSFFNVRQ
jgi:RNA recognition motif-containing protein